MRSAPDAASPEARLASAYRSAVRRLASRPRTRAELRAGLVARGFEATIVAQVLERLEGAGVLDDAEVGRAMGREAERRRLGSVRVARDLARRGVPEDAATAVVRDAEAADLARARALVERRHPQAATDQRARARAFRFLIGRGFPVRVARAAVLDTGAHDDGQD